MRARPKENARGTRPRTLFTLWGKEEGVSWAVEVALVDAATSIHRRTRPRAWTPRLPSIDVGPTSIDAWASIDRRRPDEHRYLGFHPSTSA
jgi:hypothetical protein